MAIGIIAGYLALLVSSGVECFTVCTSTLAFISLFSTFASASTGMSSTSTVLLYALANPIAQTLQLCLSVLFSFGYDLFRLVGCVLALPFIVAVFIFVVVATAAAIFVAIAAFV